jgi:23S rRNA-/tRNA-specific pseudouridylate synthase
LSGNIIKTAALYYSTTPSQENMIVGTLFLPIDIIHENEHYWVLEKPKETLKLFCYGLEYQ